MAASYIGPATSAKDAVRFLIGDTDSTEFLLQDNEIEWLLAQYNNVPLNAAIRCCETIMSKFSRMADEVVGSVSIKFSQKAKGYQTMRAELQRRLATEGAIPYAGGISKTDKKLNELNPDRVKPDFTKHEMENQQIAPWVTDQLRDPDDVNGE